MSEAIDLLDRELYGGDPEPAYRHLREQEPVYRDEANGLWGISRYDDVVHIERHPELFCSSQGYRPNIPTGP